MDSDDGYTSVAHLKLISMVIKIKIKKNKSCAKQINLTSGRTGPPIFDCWYNSNMVITQVRNSAQRGTDCLRL